MGVIRSQGSGCRMQVLDRPFMKPNISLVFILIIIAVWVLNTFLFQGELHYWAVRHPQSSNAFWWLAALTLLFFNMPYTAEGNLILGIFQLLGNCLFLHITTTILIPKIGRLRTMTVFVICGVISYAVSVYRFYLAGAIRGGGGASVGIYGLIALIALYCMFDKEFWLKWVKFAEFKSILGYIVIGNITHGYVMAFLAGAVLWLIFKNKEGPTGGSAS